MDPLASLDDVAAAMGLESKDSLPSQDKASSLLGRVSFMFRQAAGRQFTEGSATVRLKVNGGRARLTEPSITSVDAVVDDDGNAVDYTRTGQWLTVDLGSDAFVTVTYTWARNVPEEVRDAVAAAVARRLNVNPAAESGIKAVRLGADGFTADVQFANWATDTSLLSAEDRRLADSFRFKGTQVVVLAP